MDILKHKEEGFLYPYNDSAMLAEYISKYFENDELCLEYGKNAQQTALKRHNAKENLANMVKIYKDIIKGEEK